MSFLIVSNFHFLIMGKTGYSLFWTFLNSLKHSSGFEYLTSFVVCMREKVFYSQFS